jgi:hypothetical protein
MIRVQIRLTEEQAAAASELAHREGCSLAEVVRQSLHHHLRSRRVLDRVDLKRRALMAPGRFRSGSSNVASAHDHHLADPFAE